jgi:membrane peptidoglycan carboxypeptidase
VQDVTLAEAATLAALPNRPSTFLNNPDLLKTRRDWILDGMVEEGYISEGEAEEAKAQETPITLSLHNIEAPHFVLWVKEQLEDKYGARTTETGGLKVITSLDYDKQKVAEEAVTNGLAAYGATYNFNGVGLVSLDPKTGQVLSMVGSPDYWNDEADGQVNVTLRPLQPGSSIKPIVYAAAFEKGYTPNTVLWDVDTVFPTPTGDYEPHNYDGAEHGYLTMRKALQGSLNIPAVKTLYLVGIENALKFGERLGYTTLREEYVGLSMVLGGIRVTPLEHVDAFSTFANGGVRHEPVAILKVEDSSGQVLEEWKPEEHTGEQVIDANLAATVSNVLSDNAARSFVFGPNNYLTLGNRPVAAKTGTTNEYKDAWTVGYTPSLSTAVWVGNADGTLMKGAADGSKVAAPIWKEYMDRSLKGTDIESFPPANIPVTGKPILDGQIPATAVVLDTVTGKLATDLTPERFREEKICGDYHTILTYINKDDPLGEAPKDPTKQDSYYAPWEAGIQAYLSQTGEDGKPKLEACEVPTEEDDVHIRRNRPSITIQSPHKDDSVGRNLELEFSVEMVRSFGRIDLTLDGLFIGSTFNENRTTLTLPGWVSRGDHTLTATVYDDVDNNAEDSIAIYVNEDGASGDFRITNPFDEQVIEKTVTQYSIAVEVPNSESLTSLKVMAQNLWTGESMLVAETASPSVITTLTWDLPGEAQYALTASAVTANGQLLESLPITIYVKDPASAGGIPVEETPKP